MKGLIQKDLLAAKSALMAFGGILLVVFILPVVFLTVSGESLLSEGVMGIFCVALLGIFCMVNMVVTMNFGGYDDQCGWDSFGNALPVSRAKIVLARYSADLLLTAASLAVLLVVQLIYRIGGGQPIVWYFPALLVMVCLIMVAVMNPIVYKFGAQKAGYIVAGLYMAIGLGSTALGNWAGEQVSHSDEAVDAVLDNMLDSGILPAATLLGLAVCMILYGLSILLSMRIYQKKEF